MALVISAAQAALTLNLDKHTVAKLLDAGVLVGPTPVGGRRKGVYADSAQTAESVLPTSIAPGDVALHVGPLAPDPLHHDGRPYIGWHQDRSWTLSAIDRRRGWGGVWNMARDNAASHIGSHAACTVGGFIVDIAKVTDTHLCACCGWVAFDLADPDDHAVARYRGRRVTVNPGSLWS